jgi:hypothetical protein
MRNGPSVRPSRSASSASVLEAVRGGAPATARTNASNESSSGDASTESSEIERSSDASARADVDGREAFASSNPVVPPPLIPHPFYVDAIAVKRARVGASTP